METTKKVKIRKPDAIILDIVMPEKTGVRFYREIRKNPETVNIPVIIITGLESEFQNFISHRLTAPPPDGYIAKPFSQEDLLAVLQKALGLQKAIGSA